MFSYQSGDFAPTIRPPLGLDLAARDRAVPSARAKLARRNPEYIDWFRSAQYNERREQAQAPGNVWELVMMAVLVLAAVM